MAGVRRDMLANADASMRSKAAPPGQGGPTPAPIGRQFEGRRRHAGAALIEVGRIEPDPDQPRKEIDPEGLRRLAGSLASRGQLQPVRVRWDEGRDRYVIVLGERRYQAAKLAGLETLACVVAPDGATPEEILEDQLVENALREDVRPVEQARAYRSLMDRLGLTQVQLAARLNVSQSAVSKALAVLDLPEPVRARVDAGEVTRTDALDAAKAARRPGRPKAREPVTIDVEGYSVRVTFRRGSEGGDAATGLRRALRALQSRKGDAA